MPELKKKGFGGLFHQGQISGKMASGKQRGTAAWVHEVVFTSDNGMNTGHHGIWGKGNGTYPQNMYDTSVKIPFILFDASQDEKGVV